MAVEQGSKHPVEVAGISYGNVPFYWWNGDTLKYERLVEQLELLGDASTDGLSVSYIHTHPQVDVSLNALGYGGFGKADAGVPGFYTYEWWQLWNRFSAQCAKRNMGIGVDSSLANHYQTIPSAYRGTPLSGLLGPVKMTVSTQE